MLDRKVQIKLKVQTTEEKTIRTFDPLSLIWLRNVPTWSRGTMLGKLPLRKAHPVDGEPHIQAWTFEIHGI